MSIGDKPRLVLPLIVVAAATVAAISITFATVLLNRRRRRPAEPDPNPIGCCSDPVNKPQLRFKRVLADNSYTPFKHLKREEADAKESSVKMHPFEEEISTLLENPPPFPHYFVDKISLDKNSSYNWLNREDQLESLAAVLSREKAFAVDTEQHSLRSFLGYTALMQISTLDEDYLIDAIALHDSMGTLRSVFADPSIYKVFHGADNDILWLQRDFHIYVVNMFDTAKACDVLSKPQKSLAYLLETYCGVTTDKSLQREDWRLRPLSAEMIQYARCDAHYLLYIANCLISELSMNDTSDCTDDKFNIFFEASRRSNVVCMQLYAKENECPPGSSAATSILSRYSSDQQKLYESKDLIWKLCAWRDLMARIHEESVRYILSDQAIVALAEYTPQTAEEVQCVINDAELSNASSSMSPVVAAHIDELCRLLEDENVGLNEIFRHFVDKSQDSMRFCGLSIYNYSLISQLTLNQTDVLSFNKNGERLTVHPGKKASRELFIKKFSCKTPVYHNCKIYASDGRLLCHCDKKKLEWYLERNLAKLVGHNPPSIMLLFEPKGRPEDEDNEFYIQSKKNICVGCGETNHYIRYRIIPSCYRMHFPEHLKSHRSHDIVLLCVDCHETAHAAAERYKKQIAEEFGIPLFVHKIVGSGDKTIISIVRELDGGTGKNGVSPLQLRTAAMALLRHGSTMPSERRETLIQTIEAYYGGREVTPEDLEMALIAGMSPHERRRFERKKGASFRNEAEIIMSNFTKTALSESSLDSNYVGEYNNGDAEQQEKSFCGDLSSSPVCDDPSCLYDSDKERIEVSMQSEQGDTFVSTEGDVDWKSIESSAPLNGHCGKSCANEDTPVSYVNGGDNNSSADRSTLVSYEVIPRESDKRLSLLGHGPHGKLVVEHLLANKGEDGVRLFCQRWRQVFVDAVHPRFLPSGWNIKHSGRRDFGDFSVYNPSKKVPQTNAPA